MTRPVLNLVVTLPLLVCPHAIQAAAPSNDASAATLVQRALSQEIEGADDDRSDLLQHALGLEPDCAQARWHNGYVNYDGQWVLYTEFPQQIAESPNLERYHELRAAASNTHRDHMKLARFCSRHGMPLRARAHLIAALKQSNDPKDLQLLSRFGYRQVGGAWVSPGELNEAQEIGRKFAQGFKKWKRTIRQIERQLESPKLSTRQQAEEELKAISDSAALSAMELYLATGNLGKARLLVETLADMQTQWAGVFLARQAVFSPFKTVREEAAEKLQQRPPEQYAPLLLAGLRMPTEFHASLFLDASGVHLSQAFLHENQEYQQIVNLRSDTRFFQYLAGSIVGPDDPAVGRGSRNAIRRRVGVSGSDRARTFNAFFRNSAITDAIIDAQLKAYASQRHVERENELTKERNERILTALSTATGLDLPPEPEEWWQWWADYNELYEEDEKPRQYVYRREETIRGVPSITSQPAPPESAPPPGTGRSCSCLVAGTLVWTDRGAVPVEDVKVGDLALSKDVETGELTYQPVLRTTVRPERELWRVRAGHTEFEATGGHVFWISGEGWLKIRDVKPGMRFHGAAGPVMVEKIEIGGTAETYNLVVADFHNYFVGPSLILSHDPTFARPTDLRVPGLALSR